MRSSPFLFHTLLSSTLIILARSDAAAAAAAAFLLGSAPSSFLDYTRSSRPSSCIGSTLPNPIGGGGGSSGSSSSSGNSGSEGEEGGRKDTPSAPAAVVVDWDWEQMAEEVFATDERPIVLFDGVCNLCNSGVNFAIDQDENAKFRFCSLQSRVATSLLLRSGKPPQDKANIALVTKDDTYFSSDAVSRICIELDTVPLQLFGWLGQYTPQWIRESIYQFVSENRYQFGESDSCRLDFDGTYTSRFVSEPMGFGSNAEDDA